MTDLRARRKAVTFTHEFRPNDRRARFRLLPPVHEAWAALRFLGMRDRLRCPHCTAVGTWKPHGHWSAKRGGDRPVRRWLCKCCGLYNGPEGTVSCWPCRDKNVWVLPEANVQTTPFQVLDAENVWPWVG